MTSRCRSNGRCRRPFLSSKCLACEGTEVTNTQGQGTERVQNMSSRPTAALGHRVKRTSSIFFEIIRAVTATCSRWVNSREFLHPFPYFSLFFLYGEREKGGGGGGGNGLTLDGKVINCPTAHELPVSFPVVTLGWRRGRSANEIVIFSDWNFRSSRYGEAFS